MATDDPPPNILLVITDQQRPDWVGMNDDVPVRTPALASLADRGVWFRNAVSPSPICGPARACLASGLDYPRSEVHDNGIDYPTDVETYYRRLRDEAGYHVLCCGDMDLHMGSPIWGRSGDYMLDRYGFSDGIEIPGKLAQKNAYYAALGPDGWDSDGPPIPADVDPGAEAPADPYTADLEEQGLVEQYVEDVDTRSYFTDTHPVPLPAEAYVDNWVGRRGLELLDTVPEDTPWHLSLNFVGPHPPWDVTEEMHGWYRDPDVEFPAPVDPNDELSTEDHQEIRRNYAAMIENIDRWLGRFLDRLEERGELENTVVIFTSDHGEMLGDHGEWSKCIPRHESMAVPLVVSGPGVERRGASDEPASMLDVHSTILEYAGLGTEAVDSRSLVPYLSGRTDGHRDVVRSAYEPWAAAFDGRHKLVRGYDFDANEPIESGEEVALFDLEADPDELDDISASSPDIVESLRPELG